jgi:hypothetical protein
MLCGKGRSTQRGRECGTVAGQSNSSTRGSKRNRESKLPYEERVLGYSRLNRGQVSLF